MLTITKLRNFLSEVKTQMPDIKFTEVITSDKEFTEHLKERKSSENTILMAVAPDHTLAGTQDKTRFGTYMQFFLFDKSIETTLVHSKKLDLYAKIEGIAKELITRIINTKSGDDGSEGGFDIDCGMFDFFNEESVEIELWWDGGQCRGYEINFFLESN